MLLLQVTKTLVTCFGQMAITRIQECMDLCTSSGAFSLSSTHNPSSLLHSTWDFFSRILCCWIQAISGQWKVLRVDWSTRRRNKSPLLTWPIAAAFPPWHKFTQGRSNVFQTYSRWLDLMSKLHRPFVLPVLRCQWLLWVAPQIPVWFQFHYH